MEITGIARKRRHRRNREHLIHRGGAETQRRREIRKIEKLNLGIDRLSPYFSGDEVGAGKDYNVPFAIIAHRSEP